MKRYLDSIEENVLYTFDGHHTVEYRGTLNAPALQNAFKELCRKYPALRAEILRDKEGFLLQVTDHHKYAEFSVLNGGLETLLSDTSATEACRELEIGEARRNLSSLLLIRGKSQGYVRLAIHHVLTGGGTGPFFMRELWRLYTDVVQNREIDTNVEVFPKSPAELLRDRWGRTERSHYDRTADAGPEPKHQTGAGTVRTIRLPPEKTSKLVDLARSFSVSVNALLLGEIASILHRFDPMKERKTLKVDTSVSLHNRIFPPVSFPETTFFTGRLAAHVAADADPVTIGREFKTQINNALENHAVWITGFGANGSLKDIPSKRNSDIWWSGMGKFPSFAIPNDLEIVDYFIAQKKLGEVYSAQGKDITAAEPPRLTVQSYTINGELCLILTTLTKRKVVLDKIEERIEVMCK